MDPHHRFIGGISFSMGLIGEEIPGMEDKDKIESLCTRMEEQAEIAQKYVKHLECLRPEYSPKNAIAHSVFSEN